MFLTLMVVGLVGLVMMAIPAFGRHGAGHSPAPGHAHYLHGSAVRAQLVGARGAASKELVAGDAGRQGWSRRVPSPRAIFSVFALYGAFGNALIEAAHLPLLLAALVAVVPALLVERFVVRPVWNLVFRFQAAPCSPLEELIFAEARAVVPFRNGRGMVSLTRDGRHVQFAARLRDEDSTVPINVGDRLRIEDIDAQRERLTVSVLRDE